MLNFLIFHIKSILVTGSIQIFDIIYYFTVHRGNSAAKSKYTTSAISELIQMHQVLYIFLNQKRTQKIRKGKRRNYVVIHISIKYHTTSQDCTPLLSVHFIKECQTMVGNIPAQHIFWWGKYILNPFSFHVIDKNTIGIQ